MKAFVSAQLSPEGMEKLRTYCEVKEGGWGSTGVKLTPEELVKEAADCEIMVICYEEINDYVLDHLPKLKMICCSRGGVENIDKAAVHRHPEVFVCSAPGRNANAVAELTVALIIDALRYIPQTYSYIKSEQWEKVPWDIAGNTKHKTFEGDELWGRTVGIVGYGIIGERVAKLLSGFDVKIIAYDPFRKKWPEGVRSVTLEQLFEESDVVTLHCKVTDENKGMINKKLFDRMRPNAVFINTARGVLVDEEDLYQALKEKKLFCAALDAQIHEPMPHDSRFLELDNCIITPHIGGASRDMIAQQTRIMFEDIDAFFKEGKPIHVI